MHIQNLHRGGILPGILGRHLAVIQHFRCNDEHRISYILQLCRLDIQASIACNVGLGGFQCHSTALLLRVAQLVILGLFHDQTCKGGHVLGRKLTRLHGGSPHFFRTGLLGEAEGFSPS